MRKKYPWELWFDSPRTVILRGVHYRCSQSTMAQIIRNNASTRGVSVSIVDTETEITIEVHSERKEISDIRSGLLETRSTTASP